MRASAGAKSAPPSVVTAVTKSTTADFAAPSFQLGRGSAALLAAAKDRKNSTVTAGHSARRLIAADPDAPLRLARQPTCIVHPVSAAVVGALIERQNFLLSFAPGSPEFLRGRELECQYI
jgi:hypothetical protein